MSAPAPEPVTYLCGDCGADNTLKPEDAIQCRECGYRILYKRTQRRGFLSLDQLSLFNSRLDNSSWFMF